MSKQIISFGAHPDDIEIGCAGTEYQLIQSGYEATHVYVSSGDAGSQTISKAELIKIREAEALDSAKLLGVKQVEFLKCHDGMTGFSAETRVTIINLIRKIKPEIIFVHGQCDLFSDHKIVHNLVMSAIQFAAGPWFQETEGEPWSVKNIFGYEVWHPMQTYQWAVNITDFLDIKMKALSCFPSQVKPTRYDEAFKGLARYRGVMSWIGEYAEVFEILKAELNFKQV